MHSLMHRKHPSTRTCNGWGACPTFRSSSNRPYFQGTASSSLHRAFCASRLTIHRPSSRGRPRPPSPQLSVKLSRKLTGGPRPWHRPFAIHLDVFGARFAHEDGASRAFARLQGQARARRRGARRVGGGRRRVTRRGGVQDGLTDPKTCRCVGTELQEVRAGLSTWRSLSLVWNVWTRPGW